MEEERVHQDVGEARVLQRREETGLLVDEAGEQLGGQQERLTPVVSRVAQNMPQGLRQRALHH